MRPIILKQLKLFFLIILNVGLLLPSGATKATANRTSEPLIISSAGDTLKALGLLVERNKVSNSLQAIKYARIALNIARHTDSITNLVDAYKWIGKAYLQNQIDSSVFYYNRALRIADSCHLITQKVHIYYNLASIYNAAYNYKSAVSLLDSSINLAKLVKDPEGISNAYIAIGNIKFNIHDFVNARLMYEAALEIARKGMLYKQMGVAMGNLARKPFELDTQKSLAKQREALGYLNKVKGVELEMAYIYINMGFWSAIPDTALYYYKSALKLALNANLSKVVFGAYNDMAYSYLDKKDVKTAESCLNQAIPLALQMKDNEWLASLYDTYADVCVQKGDFKNAFEFQRKAKKAKDLDYIQKATDQIRLLAALSDLKSKELIIQNEEMELLVQRNKLQRTELWLVIALLLMVGSVFTILILQQRNNVKLQKAQISSAKRIIEMEEGEKGRIARELHDLTGQLVLGISGSIENIEFLDPAVKDHINARIKELGTSIRHISHRMNSAMIEHFTFSEMITGLCEDMQKLSRMKISLDMTEEFPNMPNELVLHFYRITQELLTNAGKHARESQVKIKIFAKNDKLFLVYSDNGSGFTVGGNSKPSMGILNIYERAKLVGGQAHLTSAPGEGTTWEIFFQLDKKI